MDEANSKTTAMVYEILRQRVLNGYFSPDEKLNQMEIAKDLDVSRTPVTKALHMLEMDGLVDNIPQRGFFIHKVTLREMMDLMMLRQSLEMVAAYNAAETATDGEIEALVALFTPFADADGNLDTEAYQEADQRFHDSLMDLCGNRLVSKINGSMGIMNKTYAGGLLRSPAETLPEHLALINAIRSRNPQEAQLRAMEHLESTRRKLRETDKQLINMGIDTSNLPILELNMGGKGRS